MKHWNTEFSVDGGSRNMHSMKQNIMIKKKEEVGMHFPKGLGYLFGLMYCRFWDYIFQHRSAIYFKSYLLHTEYIDMFIYAHMFRYKQ